MILSFTVALSLSAGLIFVSFADDGAYTGSLRLAAVTDDIGETEDPGEEEDTTPPEDTSPEDIEDIDFLFVASDEDDYDYQPLSAEAGTGSFRVQVPDSGYLEITNGGGGEDGQSFGVKAQGFEDFRNIGPDESIYIGVDEGIYSFEVSTESESYVPGIKFRKVNEAAYGSKKAEGELIKSGKIYKGLFRAATEGKQVHWYKFKNPKDQKVSLDVYNSTLSGSSDDTIKVSVYSGKKHIDYTISRENGKSGKRISIYNKNNKKKLVKGTYYIKVVRNGDCSGCFKLRLN